MTIHVNPNEETSGPNQPTETLHEQREWLRVTLSSTGDAVITTDTKGSVTYLNPVAESLTGWPQAEAAGIPLEIVFKIINENSRLPQRKDGLRVKAGGAFAIMRSNSAGTCLLHLPALH